MIPRRQGFPDINATIPVGDGQLPPLPQIDAVNGSGASANAAPQPVVPKNHASQVIDGITFFSKVTRKDAADAAMLKLLTDKKLIVIEGEYAVVSEKGLRYLVDFTL